jgi:hypothetical protein
MDRQAPTAFGYPILALPGFTCLCLASPDPTGWYSNYVPFSSKTPFPGQKYFCLDLPGLRWIRLDFCKCICVTHDATLVTFVIPLSPLSKNNNQITHAAYSRGWDKGCPSLFFLKISGSLFSVEQVNDFGYRKVTHQGDQDMGGQSPELSANRNRLTGRHPQR